MFSPLNGLPWYHYRARKLVPELVPGSKFGTGDWFRARVNRFHFWSPIPAIRDHHRQFIAR